MALTLSVIAGFANQTELGEMGFVGEKVKGETALFFKSMELN